MTLPANSVCLVTGGEGFIGSHVVERLLRDGHTVRVIDDRSAIANDEFFRFDGAEYHTADIRNAGTRDLYDGVDYVFHLAARARIQPTIDDPGDAFLNNALGTQAVLENARRANVKRVVYSASSSVYGRKNTLPLMEAQTPDCLNPYSLSKLQGEQICSLYARLYGLSAVALRYFNVYGPREPLKGKYAPVVGIFKRQRDNGQPLTIVGSGEKRRDFTYVLDVVEANLIAATAYLDEQHSFEVFNVGTGTNYSILEVAEMVGGEITHIPDRPAEAIATLADTTKIESRLGWTAKFSLPDVINSY